MEGRAAEGSDAADGRIGRLVELADRGDHDPRIEAGAVRHGHGPPAGGVVVRQRLDHGVEANQGSEAEGVHDLLDVLEDLGLLRVLARPDVGVERVGVERRGHVTGCSRIRVVAPGATDVC